METLPVFSYALSPFPHQSRTANCIGLVLQAALIFSYFEGSRKSSALTIFRGAELNIALVDRVSFCRCIFGLGAFAITGIDVRYMQLHATMLVQSRRHRNAPACFCQREAKELSFGKAKDCAARIIPVTFEAVNSSNISSSAGTVKRNRSHLCRIFAMASLHDIWCLKPDLTVSVASMPNSPVEIHWKD